MSRPDIAYAIHPAVRFSANSKASLDKGVKSIIKYLKGTKENGLIMYPKNDKGLEFFGYIISPFSFVPFKYL